jgi:hypothetical protein
VQLAQDGEPVEARKQEVEDDGVVGGGERLPQAVGPVPGAVHAKALRFQAPSEEREDSGLVLDDQDLHDRGDDPNPDDLQMTAK